MKRLLIAYGDTTIFDAEVDEFTWHDAEGSVAVTGKTKPARAATSGLLDMLTSASRRQTETKRAELAATVDAEEAS